MTSSTAHRRRGLGALLVPLVIVLGALPLMAPTCGSSGEGVKVFSRRSLIIPMDVCYQYMADGVRSSYTPAGGSTACPAVDSGDVIKAYGLVYQLIRNGIAVYWVIDNAKTAVDGVDLTVQYDGGSPVFLYNWTTGLEGAAPTIGGGGHLINYRGGPFVVDGSDFDRASTVLQSFRSTFGAVNVHVSNVAFRGYSKRTMAGGWSAGGNVPPKLALLDIGSDGAGAKNSEVVIQGYLTRAGLDTAGAAGTTAPGAHGQIFDRLFMPDFLPGTPGDWTTTALARNQYQVLWVPHWAAPSSCSDCPPSTSCTCSNKYTATDIAASLKTMGAFVNQVNPLTGSRGDVFAECAGLGSFEGVFSSADPSTTSYSSTYVLSSQAGTGGEPTTHFETTGTTGVWINKATGSALYRGSYSSPFMQIGDYPFIPRTGAIQNFKPNLYKGEVVPLISEATNPTYDIFTLVPASAAHGTIVYMGGHSYSGTDGSFEVAGTRLVLNTLFNLGAACQEGGGCTTGLPGVCATGHYKCLGGPDPTCVPDIQPGQLPETCNGLDDNCNGEVDEALQTSCYGAPAGYVDPLGRTGDPFLATSTVGVCRAGVSVCQHNADGSYSMSACTGQVLPSAESCNGLDDDCNGSVDDGIAPIACYDGPPSTLDVGICRAGSQVCQAGQWGGPAGAGFVQGACAGEVLPKAENCSDSGPGQVAQDDDCNGVVNNGCVCTPGQTQACFTGPGTAGVGTCTAGTQTCQTGGFWGQCQGQVVATATEACVPSAVYDAGNIPASYDTNCDARFTRCPECNAGQVQPCPDSALPALPAGSSWGVGQCSRGTQSCTAGGTWGACTGFVLPSTDATGAAIEYCDGKDNNCNGTTDENSLCPAGEACLRGVCVQATCGTERPPPEGYACSSSTVVSSACGDAPAPGCAVGQLCQYGNCVDPCPTTTVNGTAVSSVCATGTVCGGGACIAGGCYEAGCPTGEVCLKGACQTDPCAGKLCPGGTFCRQGDCVQACTFVTCYVGEKCGIDGFCEPDACAGKLCAAGQRCTNGTCAPDPCLGKGCAAGQICQVQGTAAVCVDDPCTGVVCPAGQCASGQCYPSGNPTGAGTASRATSKSSGGCGCGSGSGAALPALLALLALPLARRRRRPAPGGRGMLLLLLVSVALVGSACKSSKTQEAFDPSKCAATCSGEQRCIDLTADPSHCGACNHACNAGEQCVDSVCGPTALVAPYLRSLSPATGVKDNPSLFVSLAGDRFQQGIDVRVTVGASTSAVPCDTAACPAVTSDTAGACCQWLSTGSLSLRLNLTNASPTVPWTLRVVNPDGVISNSRSLAVVIPTPTIAGVTPTTVPAGSSSTLTVSGSGFTRGSRCHLSSVPGVGDLVLPPPAYAGGGTQLECALDATSIPPGVYPFTVVSEPDASGVTHASNAASITVAPSDPVIYSVDPTSAATVASFLVTGVRFDPATAAVLFYTGTTPAALPPANVTVMSTGSILVHDLAVGTGTPYPNNAYTVAVRTGAAGAYRTSNAVSFYVGAASSRTVNTFTPSLAYQGDAVTLTFTGADFPANSQIELEPPGSTTYTALPTSVTGASTASSSASAGASFVGQPDGQWYARLRFGATASDPTSSPWPLRILSNQAILRDYAASPAPAQGGSVGGTKDSLVFSVSNIRSPNVKIFLVDPSGATTVQTLDPTVTPTVGTSTLVVDPAGSPALNLTGYATGTYTFRVANPNAQPSNALPFAVNPGQPTVATACLAGTSCTRYGVQGQAVTIRLTGTNFAAPDTSGNGSIVMAAADFMSNWAAPDPCNVITTTGTQFQQVPGTVTVVNATTIDVQVDTLSAYVDPAWGTTYYVGVWNPGGVSGLQKSSCGVDPRTLPWFRLCAKATGTTCTQ